MDGSVDTRHAVNTKRMVMKQRLRAFKVIPVYVLCLLALIGVGCSSEEEQEACLVRDQILVLDQQSIDDKTYTLVHRLSGFQEKIEYVELYAGKPTFNRCGETDLMPIGAIDFDHARGRFQSMAFRGGVLTIIYTQDDGASKPLQQARLKDIAGLMSE